MQQHKQTITCLEKSGFWRELSTYRKPPFAVFLLFTFSASSTSVHMQRQNQSLLLHCGDRESFHERRAALHTAQPSSCGCVCTVYFVLAQQSIVAVWCLAVSNKGRTFVSEHPEQAEGAGSPCPAGAGCSVFKKDMSTLHQSRKSFLAYAGVFFVCVEPSFCQFRYCCTTSPLYRCVSVGKGGDEGLEIDPKLGLQVQPPWNFGNV